MSSSHVEFHPSLADFDLIAEVSQMLTVHDQDRVLERVIELMVRAVNAQRMSLLINPDFQEDWNRVFARYVANINPPDEPDKPLRLARRVLDRGLAGWVLRERRGAVVYDTTQDERWHVFPDSTSGTRSALCVPFVYQGQALAALTLTHTEPYHFDEYHLRLLTIVANQATIAIRNAQLVSDLLRQRQQIEAVLHAIPDLLFVLDQNGSILLANDAAATLLSSADDPNGGIGQPISKYIENDNILDFVQGMLEKPLQTGQTWSFQTRSEKQRRDFLVTVSAWQSPNGDSAGVVIVMRDITTLRDLNRFKDEMLQMASHDLRSPLALIVGYCSLIALDTPQDSPIHEYLSVIERSIERMRGLLDDLLRVEQIRNSPLELNTAVDFGEMVDRVINDMSLLAHNKQQTLEARVALEGVPNVLINPIFVREAMENLIGNAIKYTPECGHITVETFAEDNRLHFIVEDNGIGISPEHLERVFESFYRTRQTGTEHVDGRGLGLSLVKTIIERHGGEVWVESELGAGSRFGFWLPLP